MTQTNKKRRIKRLLIKIVTGITIFATVSPSSTINVKHFNIDFTSRVYVTKIVNGSQK